MRSACGLISASSRCTIACCCVSGAYTRVEITYHDHTSQTRLHFLERELVFNTHNLSLQLNGLFQSLQDDVRECGNEPHAIVCSIRDERVEDLVSSGAKLVVRVPTFGDLQNVLNALLEVWRQGICLASLQMALATVHNHIGRSYERVLH